MFKRLDATNIPIDQDYAYINTFIVFLKNLVDVINVMWNNFVNSLSGLFDTLKSITAEETTTEG